jgi:hypothetical protein
MRQALKSMTVATVLFCAPLSAEWEGDDPAERLLLDLAERVELVAEELDGLEDVVIGAYLGLLEERLVLVDKIVERLEAEGSYFAPYIGAIQTVREAIEANATVEQIGLYREQVLAQLEDLAERLRNEAESVREEVEASTWPMLLRLGDALKRLADEI